MQLTKLTEVAYLLTTHWSTAIHFVKMGFFTYVLTVKVIIRSCVNKTLSIFKE